MGFNWPGVENARRGRAGCPWRCSRRFAPALTLTHTLTRTLTLAARWTGLRPEVLTALELFTFLESELPGVSHHELKASTAELEGICKGPGGQFLMFDVGMVLRAVAVYEVTQRCKKSRIVTFRVWQGRQKMPLNDEQIPNTRGVRVAPVRATLVEREIGGRGGTARSPKPEIANEILATFTSLAGEGLPAVRARSRGQAQHHHSAQRHYLRRHGGAHGDAGVRGPRAQRTGGAGVSPAVSPSPSLPLHCVSHCVTWCQTAARRGPW